MPFEANFNEKVNYYFWATYHKKALDKILESHEKYFIGKNVLDIGGRDRGIYHRPIKKAKKWITADIKPERNPDIVLDVAHMEAIADESFDVINATELFEHVKKIRKGLKECYRVLRPGGYFIISTPFLYRIHADPYDFQRWTNIKWRQELENIGFKIIKFKITGRFFLILAGMHKSFLDAFHPRLLWLKFLFHPLLDFIAWLDKINLFKKNKILRSFHDGYFIIVRKPNSKSN